MFVKMKSFIKRTLSILFVVMIFSSCIVSAASTSKTMYLRGDGTTANTSYFSLNAGSAKCTATYSTTVNENTAKHTISAKVYLGRWRWYGYDSMGSMTGVSNYSVANSTNQVKTYTASSNTATMYSLIKNGSYYFVTKFSGSTTAYYNQMKVTISQ